MLESRESRRIQDVQQPVIPVVSEWIRQCPGTLSLAQGVVSFGPPKAVSEAVSKLDWSCPELNRYGATAGSLDLLRLIERKLRDENDTLLADRSLFATAGSNMAFLTAILSIADVGDEIILITPYYFNHYMAIEIAGCRVVCVAADADYQPEIDAISSAISHRTRAVVSISPNNPSGTVYRRSSLEQLNALCAAKGIYHIHDEAYEYFVFGDEPHFSPGSLPGSAEHTISLYSLSKAYGMAGWRVGYAVIPAGLSLAMNKVQDTNLICLPNASITAACAALQTGRQWCYSKINSLAEIRLRVVSELAALGSTATINQAEGGFYLLLQLDTKLNDLQLVEALIRQHGVAVLPGSAFGITEKCVLRISYGGLSLAGVAPATKRLVKGVQSLVRK